MQRISLTFFSFAMLTACSSDKPGTVADELGSAGPASSDAPGGSSIAATGDTIVVEMYSDAAGNYYKPSEIEAERGDVVRFVLKSGVHNVNFLSDSNTIKTGLPPVNDMLQLPEQTHDMVVSLAKGKYYFHCDPHAMLGMKGHLEVGNEGD